MRNETNESPANPGRFSPSTSASASTPGSRSTSATPKPLAARHQREHQRPASPISAQEERLVDPQPATARRHRQVAQHETPQDSGLYDTIRGVRRGSCDDRLNPQMLGDTFIRVNTGSTDFSGATCSKSHPSRNRNTFPSNRSFCSHCARQSAPHNYAPGGGTNLPTVPNDSMTLFIISIPFMALAVALAVLPLVVTFIREHHRLVDSTSTDMDPRANVGVPRDQELPQAA
jgi:hypothetical protein